MPCVGYHPDRLKWALVLLLFFRAGYSEGDGATEDDFRTWNLPDGAIARLGKGDFRGVAFFGNDRFLRVATDIGVWVYEVATSRTLAFFPTGGVQSIATSPNGTTVATGSDHTVQLWDAVTGENIATLEGHERGGGGFDNFVTILLFSPDGVYLASRAADGLVKLWEVATQTEVATWPGDDTLMFSPDGTTLITRNSRFFERWNVESRVKIATTPEIAPRVPFTLVSRGGWVLSPDATLVALTVWNWDRDTVDRVEVWDLRTGEKIVTLKANGCLDGLLLFSPDGTSLACGSERGFHLWDVENWESIPIERDQERVLSISFTPDGTTLASARLDGRIKLWDVATGYNLATIEAHGAGVLSVSFSSDGAILASGSHDGTVKLWDGANWQGTTTFSGHSGNLDAVAFSPDGATLAAASWYGTVELWEIAAPGSTVTLRDIGLVNSVAFSPGGTTLAAGYQRGTYGYLRLWDLPTGQVATIACRDNGARRLPLAFSHDGTLAVGWGGTVGLWDVTTGDRMAGLEGHTAVVNSVSFSPSGMVAAGLRDGTVHLWDVAKEERVAVLEGHGHGVSSVSFSPDGGALASGSFDQTVHLWDVSRKERVAILEGHRHWVTSVAFSPDGTVLAAGSSFETKLWDVAAQTEIAFLEGHRHGVSSVAFSPDGTTLASSSLDGTILLWDMSPYIRSAPTAIRSPLSPLPRQTALVGNFPNPFNTTTLIEYDLAEPGDVGLVIHNALGQPVRTLVDGSRRAGYYSVEWNARDDGSTLVASGVYLARLSHPGGAQTRRLMFLK